MRERRWEARAALTFPDVLALGERLASLGLAPATPGKEIICYIEEWPVPAPQAIDRLDPWTTEDVTLVHIHEGWRGDFFLLSGGYHTVYQRHQSVGTYCSIGHPWTIPETLRTLRPGAMFWLGFRHAHSFIRVRLHTAEVVTPRETRADDRRELWVDERRRGFASAIKVLNLPVEPDVEGGSLVLRPFVRTVPFFCSWPDAFGPCQFEFNSPDAFEFLVPASRLAATHGREPATIRAYLTGFSEPALKEFEAVQPDARYAYRCSAHCQLGELPDVLRAIAPAGRLYATLCEFQTQGLLPDGADAWAIVGVMGVEGGGFQVEVRLNRAPLPENEMAEWLQALLGMPAAYAPLPPFV
ncbi:MAG: hypothetical protein EPO02_03635 [Nitrospirae bacterium]|nr:MAG: hypothetical protein EPO02_03635 [Nitrospirota bacterium]